MKSNLKKKEIIPSKTNLIVSQLKDKKSNPNLPMNLLKSEMIKLLKNKWKNKKFKPFSKLKKKSYFFISFLEYPQRKISYK